MPGKALGWGIAILALLAGLAPATARGDERSDKVDKIFAAWDKPASPGVALAIIENGAIVYKRGYGLANLELNVPLSPEAVFYIASTSKQFTAMCAILLSLQGKLSLDDDVRNYVPELPDYGTPITLRQMANHSSGLRDEHVLAQISGRDFGEIHRDEAVALVARQKELNFEPGTQYAYSNSGYLLLSLVVERVSGKNFREFAQDAIFGPLGMTHSRFHDDYRIPIMNRASGYIFLPESGQLLNYISTYDGVGAGGLYTSVEDLALWDRNFYEPRVGGEEALRLLQTPGILKNGQKLDYGLGLMLGRYKGLPIVHHGGILEGFRAELMRFPEQRFSVIVLANLSTIDPTQLSYQVADVYLTDRFIERSGPKPQEKSKFIFLPESRLKELAGTYVRADDRSLLELPYKDGRLTVIYEHVSYPLSAVSDTEFHVADAAVFRFEKPKAGRPPAFTLYFGQQKPALYERIRPVTPSLQDLPGIAGDYWCGELEAVFRLAVRDDRLFFVHKNAPKEALTPTAVDQFTAGLFALRIVREASRGVTGFRLDTPRARDFWCEKFDSSRPPRGGN